MKTKKPTLKVILADKLYVPKKAFLSLSSQTRKLIIKEFQKYVYDPATCIVKINGKRCSKLEKFIEENPNDSPITPCRKCPLARKKLSCIKLKKIKFKEKIKKYVVFYIGDIDSIELVINCLKKLYNIAITDKRTIAKLPDNLRFKIKWKKLEEPRKSEQKRVAEKWLQEKTGTCILPPRSGKTILSSIIASKLGLKTIVIAHQKELLEQFQKDWLFATSLKKNQIKINPTNKEIKKLAVCLYTIQQFTSKYGKKRLKSIRSKFGLLIIDEVHKAASPAYSKAVNKIRAKYRLGVTATFSRRDQKDFIVRHTIGLPKVEGGSEMLSCNYRICNTNWIMPTYQNMNGRTWNYLWSRLSKDKKRNEYITKLVIKDLKKGHKVIIPVKFVKHVVELSNMIRTAIKNENLRKVYVREYSSSLVKGAEYREKISQEIREGKFDVVVAVSSMISLGFNAPKMSCIYINAGGYMFDRNNLYQQYSRVRTPCKGKNKPLIRVLKDTGEISLKSVKLINAELNSKDFNKLKEVGIIKGKRGWNI